MPDAIETPSGKNETTENFPVGSFLISRRLRPHVAAYYAWARAIDDIADNPSLPAEEKLARLDLMAAALRGETGRGAPPPAAAQRLRASLLETGLPFSVALDLVSAFRQDAVKNRYESWAELMDYCDRSAAPVGRFLLHLHGERDEAAFAASDALCNALQVINHLQDCRDDYLALDRVYLPEEWMAQAGAEVSMLAQPRASRALRKVFDACLEETRKLLKRATTLPALLASRRLAMEAGVIVDVAVALTGALTVRDPLRERVALSKPRYAACAARGVLRGLRGMKG